MNIFKTILDHFCSHKNSYDIKGDRYCPDCKKIKKGPGTLEVEQAVADLFSRYIIPNDKVISLQRFIKRTQKDFPSMHRDVIFQRAIAYFKFKKRNQ